MHRLMFALFLFVATFSHAANDNIEKLLRQLDNAIDSSSYYEKAKKNYIRMLKEPLRQGNAVLTPVDEYMLNMRLFDAYETYVCDSAMAFIDRNIRIARRLGDGRMLSVAQLKKAGMLGKAGLYSEAIGILYGLDKRTFDRELLAEYYSVCADIFLYHAEYAAGTEYNQIYLSKLRTYRDSVLMTAKKGTYTYIIKQAPQLLDSGHAQEACRILYGYMDKLPQDTRNYAVSASILAFIYQSMGNHEKYEEYLIRSAVADIRAVVKENNSLRSLAELLYRNGELERADHYMKHSMEDANFYNARLRNVQASRMLPVIDHAYQTGRESGMRFLKASLAVITVLALFLCFTVWYVIKQKRRLAKAHSKMAVAFRKMKMLNSQLVNVNARQKKMNMSLHEANMIKEVYVGHFLNLCSAYINKFDAYRRMLGRLASANKREELIRTLKSTNFINKELKYFYHNFDSSFLKIFPDFVERFNGLLLPEESITPRHNGQLTTELRIFALIRLGITDSQKIASFLNYSITTIYTYRSKMKNRAVNKDCFEDDVMSIGSFSK